MSRKVLFELAAFSWFGLSTMQTLFYLGERSPAMGLFALVWIWCAAEAVLEWKSHAENSEEAARRYGEELNRIYGAKETNVEKPCRGPVTGIKNRGE
jgi:hypothetical protein